MTTYFVKNGNKFMLTDHQSMDLHTTLPVGTYTIKYNEMAGMFYLEEVEDFTLPEKVYGDTTKNTERILRTFLDRTAPTGILLSGEKGSGKTLLAKSLSVTGRAAGIPTIVINQPWAGEAFNGFIQSIEQETIVIFDEFEKVYDTDTQEKLLTLFDGVYPSQKLFVVTCNNQYRIDTHMMNRPGRIYYRLNYEGLGEEFITEYCEDNLNDKDQIDGVLRASLLFSKFNFDILKAMVEEMNRYGETAQQVMVLLNAKPQNDDYQMYKVGLVVEGEMVEKEKLHNSSVRAVPLASSVTVAYYNGETDEDGDPDWDQAVFTPSELVKIEARDGMYYYENSEGAKLILTKEVSKSAPNWDLAF
jgi:hypothetical protein